MSVNQPGNIFYSFFFLEILDRRALVGLCRSAWRRISSFLLSFFLENTTYMFFIPFSFPPFFLEAPSIQRIELVGFSPLLQLYPLSPSPLSSPVRFFFFPFGRSKILKTSPFFRTIGASISASRSPSSPCPFRRNDVAANAPYSFTLRCLPPFLNFP